jgi:hypothetical protein
VDPKVVKGVDPIPWNAPCLRCHRGEAGTAPLPPLHDHPGTRRKVPTNYGATVVIETPISMVGRIVEQGRPLFPLYGEDGKAGMGGRPGCLTCHDPHAGSIIKRSGGGGGAVKYLRDPSGSFLYELCVPCHKKEAGEKITGFHSLPRNED